MVSDDTPSWDNTLEGLRTKAQVSREATREATQELLATTLEHVLRTFGARPRSH